MKCLTEDGTVVNAVPLTDAQALQHDCLRQWLHGTVCRSNFHSDWSRKYDGLPQCELLANFLILHFDITEKNGFSLYGYLQGGDKHAKDNQERPLLTCEEPNAAENA